MIKCDEACKISAEPVSKPVLIRNDFTGLLLGYLHIPPPSPPPPKGHITKDIGWTGLQGVASQACTVAWMTSDITAPMLPACLPTPSNTASVWHKDQEKVPVPWGCRRKQLRRNKLLILMCQGKEKRERTRAPRKNDSIWLWCVCSAGWEQCGEYRIARRGGTEQVEVARWHLRNYMSCGE